MQTIANEIGWYTPQEFADIVGVSRPTVVSWMNKGTLKFHRIPGKQGFRKISVQELARMLRQMSELEELKRLGHPFGIYIFFSRNQGLIEAVQSITDAQYEVVPCNDPTEYGYLFHKFEPSGTIFQGRFPADHDVAMKISTWATYKSPAHRSLLLTEKDSFPVDVTIKEWIQKTPTGGL